MCRVVLWTMCVVDCCWERECGALLWTVLTPECDGRSVVCTIGDGGAGACDVIVCMEVLDGCWLGFRALQMSAYVLRDC